MVPGTDWFVSAFLSPKKEYVFLSSRFIRSGKEFAFMNSLLFRFLPLHACWLVSLGIILKYRSALSMTAFVTLLLLLVAGTYSTLVLLRKLPDGRLWLFYIAVVICCVCNALFIMAVAWNTTALILGGLPFALLLVPTLVTSLVFMMETGTIRVRAILAAICFHASCLPILILATLLMAF